MEHRSHGIRGWVRILLVLTRVRITVAVTITTATGYFLGAGELRADMWMPVLGVFLLASGSSALNQWQDLKIDALMERTKRRPLPAGLIDRSTVVFLSVLLMLLGLAVLTSGGGDTVDLLLLSGLAVLWYNGVYTYLKRITAFAVVPGALIGAIPPVIGYVAAGGAMFDPLVLLVAMFFFIWQIPHFWLLLMMCGQQYGDAGLPTLTNVFSQPQLMRITFMWLMATVVAGLAFPTVGFKELAMPWNLAIVLASIWLAAKAVGVLQAAGHREGKPAYRRMFMQINAYALMVVTCLSLNALGVAT